MKPSIEDLERELRAVPREAASVGFTERVMRLALDPQPAERSSWIRWLDAGAPRLVAALASIALAALLGVAFSELSRDRAVENVVATESGAATLPVEGATAFEPVRLHDFVESQRRATLESEYFALQEELQRLRRLQAVRDSVAVVPGAGEYDYYIDLRSVLTTRTSGSATIPVSNRPR